VQVPPRRFAVARGEVVGEEGGRHGSARVLPLQPRTGKPAPVRAHARTPELARVPEPACGTPCGARAAAVLESLA
jgi:hypothetical protein